MKITEEQKQTLMVALKSRFDKNKNRHPDIERAEVEASLVKHPDKLWSVYQMDISEGEPDVIGKDPQTGGLIFCDCAPESPKGRRSLCYDRAAWEGRKENKPADNAMDVAAAIGIEMLNEAQYRHLQTLGKFDEKTSSWIVTPPEIRQLGGALFCDRRFNHVFTYHNGAESFYAARGFRGSLRI